MKICPWEDIRQGNERAVKWRTYLVVNERRRKLSGTSSCNDGKEWCNLLVRNQRQAELDLVESTSEVSE